ncbi:MAG: class I SAM-dependent methyltransferase [Cyclobacteriaceae bacterium]|nr:class I SAM-dependent methyltransferase [Cyclobacteriaceae bacterium]
MNQEKHWNKIAPSYEDEIFDVFKSDTLKILPKYFKKHADKNNLAIDFGCGVGKSFAYLSPLFKTILATDISAECISIAKQKGYPNIQFKRADLTSTRLSFPQADFAFCCNVAMLPGIQSNIAIFKNIQKALKPNGHAVIVIPSLESILYAAWRLLQWYETEGVNQEDVPNSELNYFKGSKKDIIQGQVYINGVLTKHYTQEEIHVLLKGVGLTVTAIEKVQYNWSTEFSSPPAWMQDPYPWDWLVACKK